MTVTRLGKMLLGTALILSSVAASATSKSHEIQKGDTLWVIAAKHHTTPKAIARANGISENATLKLGSVLRIPGKDTPTKSKRTTSHKSSTSDAVRRAVAIRTRGLGRTIEPRDENTQVASIADTNESLVHTALACRGLRYRFGGVGPRGFDCSGFTRYVYAKYGVCLPHSSAAQATMGKPVSRGELRAGDLLFFSSRGRTIGHVGIYIGGNQFVHAATYSRGVRVDSLCDGYYATHYRHARRVK